MKATLLRLLWKRHRLALCLGFLAPVALGLIAGLIYPGLREQTEALEALPFVGRFLKSEFVKPFSAVSILALPYQHPLSLILYAVLPAVPAIGLLAGERGRGALDLLLSTPLERRTLVTSVALFVLLATPLLITAPFLGTALGAAMSGELDGLPLDRYWLAGANAAGLLVFWTGATLLLSAASPDRASAALATAVVVVTAFALDSAARLAEGAAWMAHYTPYGYFRPADVAGGSPDWLARGAGLAAAGVLLAAAAREFQHRRRSA